MLALAGVTLIGRAALGQQAAPQPPDPASGTATGASTPSRVTPSRTPPNTAPGVPYLPASKPVTITIPAIGVHAHVMPLGLNSDGSIEVPPLNEKTSHAGWYTHSPTPGQLGAAVILGHIDSARHGPAVFFKLGALKPGNRVDVGRADHAVAHFTVDRVATYPKDHFPTDAVYGSTDHATLRLITCGGQFDPSKHSYRSNIVVYATLQGTRDNQESKSP